MPIIHVEDYVKKIISGILAGVVSAAFAFAIDTPYFTGYAGTLGELTFSSLDAQMFFAGQLDFNGKFLLRGEFYLKTDNLYNMFDTSLTTSQNMPNSLFIYSDDNNANFRIEDISATINTSGDRVTHYFTAFLGNYEPIGSDIFLQRHFGIDPISSDFTKSWRGLNGSSVYDFYGAGISYTARFSDPNALGLYLYYNEQVSDNTGSSVDSVVNFDLRYACVYSNLALDFQAGAGLPFERVDDSGNKVILIVRKANFHAGTSILLGNHYTTSFFAQAGFNDFTVYPAASEGDTRYNRINWDNFYLLLEPRFIFNLFELDLSFFNLPSDCFRRMLYFSNAYEATRDPYNSGYNISGINAYFVTDRLYLGNTNFTFGIHVTMALQQPLYGFSTSAASIGDWFGDFWTFLTGKYFQEGFGTFFTQYKENGIANITPYVSMPAFGGRLNASLEAQILKMTAEEWTSAIEVSVGFTTQI